MIIVLYPTAKAKGTFNSTEFEVPDSQPIACIGDTISIDDPFIPFKVVSRQFHYLDQALQKVVLGVEM